MELLNGEPVCILSGDEFLPKEGQTFVQQVESFFNEQGGSANSPFGTVRLDRKGIQNDKAHGMSRHKAASFAAIKDVLENGEIILPLKRYNVHNKEQLTGMVAAPIQIADDKYVCVVEVIGNTKFRRIYVHEVTLTKNLQDVVAVSNTVHDSENSTTSRQHQGDIANVLQNYLISKHNSENHNIKENKLQFNMNRTNRKQVVRLTESDLHRVVKKCVNEAINEMGLYNKKNGEWGKGTRTKGRLDDNWKWKYNPNDKVDKYMWRIKKTAEKLGQVGPHNWPLVDWLETDCVEEFFGDIFAAGMEPCQIGKDGSSEVTPEEMYSFIDECLYLSRLAYEDERDGMGR